MINVIPFNGKVHHIAAWANVEVLEPYEEKPKPVSEYTDNTQKGYKPT
jgi:hypothetical protein